MLDCTLFCGLMSKETLPFNLYRRNFALDGIRKTLFDKVCLGPGGSVHSSSGDHFMGLQWSTCGSYVVLPCSCFSHFYTLVQ
ncbi:hypothetical protein XELAEV_18013483mg [Xenopus laevis]|uniref:Uncharacterized protein n=1 Tax=Xenopus laevis TaxID=8355 RepID=A0A974HZH3_XENLA|nr:hypothetical protein XELAEV_18013483mg [Xenopus laevis]